MYKWFLEPIFVPEALKTESQEDEGSAGQSTVLYSFEHQRGSCVGACLDTFFTYKILAEIWLVFGPWPVTVSKRVSF
jgi:hypothetical protein